jgi:hypothetical protein
LGNKVLLGSPGSPLSSASAPIHPFFIFWQCWGWIQGFVHARQVPYHWATSQAPFIHLNATIHSFTQQILTVLLLFLRHWANRHSLCYWRCQMLLLEMDKKTKTSTNCKLWYVKI